MNEDFNEGIKIYSIDKEQEEMIIHLGNLNKFHREYKELKQENQHLKETISKILNKVSTIEHNLEKFEEIGTDEHFDYALKKVWKLKEYLISILKGEENE